MKKFVSLILAFIFVLSLCACSKNTEESIIGKWMYPNYSEFAEYVTDVIEEDIFYKVYYEFYGDGTGCTYIEGQENNPVMIKAYKYDPANDTLTFTYDNGNEVSVSCTIDGDEMYIIEGENQAKFYRQ